MKQDRPDPIESCGPSEIRHLLFSVLSESKALQLSYNREKTKAEEEGRVNAEHSRAGGDTTQE